MQDPARVADGLEELARLLEFTEAPKFKIRAYERAAETVRALAGDLAPLVEQRRLRELPGIGSAMERQIEELWNAGVSEHLARLRTETPPGASELVRVEGLTPRRIRRLHEALGIGSVAELAAACQAGRVRAVPSFGEKTEARLLEACRRWLDRSSAEPEPVLLGDARAIAARVAEALRRRLGDVALAGALRRGQETVRELEFVATGDVRRALSDLSASRLLWRVDLESGTAELGNGLRLRVHAAEPEAFGLSLLSATGTPEHVRAVESLATVAGTDLARRDEEDIYRALGLAFVPPELRNGTDELERARAGFEDLLEARDIAGFVHCHTTYSDGRHSVLEMARAAHALGMKYLTITDHSPSAHYANGVSLDRLKQQWDEIAAAELEVPIRILRGIEADILADGSLDLPDAVLEELDVVIASIHARHRLDRAAMTARLVRAMSWPVFKIWGHALGRILNHREPIDCDVPAVLDALAASRGAIELNADPHRLDLPPAWIPAARERGLRFVVSVDAHSTRGFDVLGYGVTMARRGGLRPEEVLNTLPAAEFAHTVRPSSRAT